MRNKISFFIILLLPLALAFATPVCCCWSQATGDVEEDEANVDEFEHESRILKQELELHRREIVLTERRLSILNRIRDVRKELRNIEESIEGAEERGDEQTLEKLHDNAEKLEIILEADHSRMDELATRKELYVQRFEAIRDQENISARKIDQLFPLLDKWSSLIDRTQRAFEQGKDDRGEEMTEELEMVVEAVEIRREIIGTELGIFYAEEEGELEHARELKEELDELLEAIEHFPDDLKPKERRKKQAKQPANQDSARHLPINVTPSSVAEVSDLDLRHVMPLLNQFCVDCHGEGASGDLDLVKLSHQLPLVRNRQHWINVLEQIRNRSMPPADYDPKPTDEQRLQLASWLHHTIHEFDYSTVSQSGYEPVRRLTHDQYNHAIRDLFGVDLRPADRFPAEMSATSGFDNSANTLFLNPLLMERYLNATEWVLEQALPDKRTKRQHFQTYERLFSDPNALAGFAASAWRRPITMNEQKRLEQIVAEAIAEGASRFQSTKRAMAFVLVSPNFLLISESPQPANSSRWQINDWDLATRLSLFLWSSIPDRNLQNMAADGQLRTAGALDSTIDRMLDDPKANAIGDVFAAQWLGSQYLGKRVRADPIDNPWCTESLMSAMRAETSMFFMSLIRDDLPLHRLIDARHTFLNEELAKFYEIDGIRGQQMRRVDLPIDNPRGGIFGQGALLAVTSFPGRASPVVRGRWILADVLGTPPPPPPPNVSELSERLERARGLSMREKLEIHRKNPNCYACHSQIDPLGFGLQNFDWFGRWRSSSRLDASGKLPDGSSFDGPAELKQVILATRLDDLAETVARKMLAFGLGRQLEYFDEAEVRRICTQWKQDGYKMRDLIKQIAHSLPFQYKQRLAKKDAS